MAGQKPQRAAIWSVYATGAIDCADAALLPAVFRALEVEMGLSPSTLALLVLAQSVAGALACPIWGYVVDSGQIERRDLLVLGALWWGLASLLSAAATGFTSLLLARTLLGVALPLLSPLSQSIIADLFEENQRGQAFGAAAMWCTVGTGIGGIGGTSISNTRPSLLSFSMPGWRAVFLAGAAACAVVAAIVACCCPPIPRADGAPPPALGPPRGGFLKSWLVVGRAVWRNKVWQLLTVQSLFGGLPFAGFHFLTLLMQYVGYSDVVSAVLLGAHRAGSALGALLGGWLGDTVAAAGQNRVRVAQFSVAWLLVGLLALLNALEGPAGPAAPTALGAGLFLWGLGGSFCEVGCDLPILAEVASQGESGTTRASMIAYKRAVQGVINPVGAPVVGGLAEGVFGYVPTSQAVGALSVSHRAGNALALGNALRTVALVCWPLCLAGYSVVGWQYVKHRRRRGGAAAAAASGAERQSLLHGKE